MLKEVALRLKLILNVLNKLPKLHQYMIAVLLVMFIALLIDPTSRDSGTVDIALPALLDPEFVVNEEQASALDGIAQNLPDYEWVVKKGETLGHTFGKFRMSKTLNKIREADADVLTLDVINPGDRYLFWLTGSDDFGSQGIVLARMEQVLGIEHQVVFKRNGDGFEYQEILLQGKWKKNRIIGEVLKNSNFYDEAVALGLSRNDASIVKRLLKNKIDFRKIHTGDQFQIIVSNQFIGAKASNNTRIEGVRFFNRRQEYSVFSFKGNYFDSNGEGLERAFSRFPLKKRYRISSNFNPRRRHPITGLVRPHNGTDFAVPIGTGIYAPGDGEVKRVVRHKYAGLYIEIQHSNKYRTRFLHLSKSLVRKGQRVKRGQKIALSGNTGASTGAHLHYEFHVNKKPINAMGKNVPIAIGIDRKSMLAFKRRVSDLVKMMENESLSGLSVSKSNSS
jgi:murein DD-endopeptidase